MKLPSLSTEQGRKAWAFLAIWGGSVIFTGFAAYGAWLLRANAWFVFWLAILAHAQVLVGMTAIGWALGRRTKIVITREGAVVDDAGTPLDDSDTVTLKKEGPP